MLAIGPHTHIYLFCGVTDMRKSFDGLRCCIEQCNLDKLPHCGHLFGFANRRRNMVKFLYWDGTGFWVCAKRLQTGTFWWPQSEHAGQTLEVSPERLSALLGGINWSEAPRPGWLRERPAA